jgi:glycosyltransferase involved in cell wall biosynthesis
MSITRFIIICPTRDCSLETKRLVDSLKVQSHEEWLLLIVDGSTTQEEIRKMQEIAKSDNRIKLIKENPEDPGIYSAMNQGGMTVAKFAKETDWIGFWGSDDWASDRDAFKRLSDFIANMKKDIVRVNILANKGRYVDAKTHKELRHARYSRFKGVRNSKNLLNDIRWGKCPPHQCSFISRRLLGNGSIFNTKLKLAADLDFFLGELCRGESLTNTGIDIVRIQNGGISQRQIKLRTREVVTIYKKNLGSQWIIAVTARYIRRLCHSIY